MPWQVNVKFSLFSDLVKVFFPFPYMYHRVMTLKTVLTIFVHDIFQYCPLVGLQKSFKQQRQVPHTTTHPIQTWLIPNLTHLIRKQQQPEQNKILNITSDLEIYCCITNLQAAVPLTESPEVAVSTNSFRYCFAASCTKLLSQQNEL
jgi:hypothetical protein